MATFDLLQARRQQEKVNQQIAQGQATGSRKASPSRLAVIAANKRVPRVRVLPASPEYREVLRHPNGMAFRSSGSVEWPLDTYTQRRLREGSVIIEQKEEKKTEPKETEKKNEHEQHHARSSDSSASSS